MKKIQHRRLRFDGQTIRVLTERRIDAVAGGQFGSSTGGDPHTCCWPDPTPAKALL